MRLTAVGAQRSTDDNVLGSATSHNPIDVLLVEENCYYVDCCVASGPTYKLGANSFVVERHDSDEFMKAIQALGIYWLVMNRPPLNAA